jgi:hypothetical protein
MFIDQIIGDGDCSSSSTTSREKYVRWIGKIAEDPIKGPDHVMRPNMPHNVTVIIGNIGSIA